MTTCWDTNQNGFLFSKNADYKLPVFIKELIETFTTSTDLRSDSLEKYNTTYVFIKNSIYKVNILLLSKCLRR